MELMKVLHDVFMYSKNVNIFKPFKFNLIFYQVPEQWTTCIKILQTPKKNYSAVEVKAKYNHHESIKVRGELLKESKKCKL